MIPKIRHATGLALILSLSALPAQAQQAARGFFTDPVLVLAGPGHTAPVQALVFAAADGSRLLSGGMDKVVLAWDLDADRPGPTRTLRPPLWRGPRGNIYALALSPQPDANGQRILAVAGNGVLEGGGEILVFRYPGPTGQGAGDVDFQLLGHENVITALGFTPDGRTLVSAGNDGTIRLWDVATRRSVGQLGPFGVPGRPDPINTIAIFANGTRLVAGGEDGILRLWDITTPALPRPIAFLPPPPAPAADPIANQILTLAVTPDARFLFVGLEGGKLLRYDASTLTGRADLGIDAGPNPLTGPVEAVAISPDGTRLATSTIVRKLARPAEPATVECEVELRSIPDGQLVERVIRTSNLARALAFSPDNRRLAVSGGDAQAIYVKDLTRPAQPLQERSGAGSSLWDVGIRDDGSAVRFSRVRPPAPGQLASYEGFDLRGRRFLVEGNEPGFQHATASAAGWTITPVDPFSLDVRNPQGQGWRLALDRNRDGRWWSYTVIPPNPAAGHALPLAAVACRYGIALFELGRGTRTRQFVGHASDVYALASSKDGRWLVSSSSDQTVRLWPLANADKIPPMGARFGPGADGRWVVLEVTPGGFADLCGLKKGHVIDRLYAGSSLISDPGGLLPRLDQESPLIVFGFYVRMPGGPEERLGTSKRDSPALTLFPATDQQWVVWTPKGYYDTSVTGDRRFLGWQTNQGTPARLLASTFDTIDKFEPRYRQRPGGPGPNLIDRLLDTADPIQAELALAPPAAGTADPTRSQVTTLTLRPTVPAEVDRPVLANQPTILLRYDAAVAATAARIRQLSVEVDGQKLLDLIPPGTPSLASKAGEVAVALGDLRSSVVRLLATDDLNVTRAQTLEVDNRRPVAPTRRATRLEIVAIGSDTFADDRLPRIPHAEADVSELAAFFASKLIDPATDAKFTTEQVHVRRFVGKAGAVAPAILTALDELRPGQPAKALASGDVLIVVVESHFLSLGSRSLLATADPPSGTPEPTGLLAADLASRLGQLSTLGVRVFVLLDVVQGAKVDGRTAETREWLRGLQATAKVAVAIASDQRPSVALPREGHRAFAHGVLKALDAASAGRLRDLGAPMTLFDFERTVVGNVERTTARRQRAQFYWPETIPVRARFLAPDQP
jgi:WD40 repeat protein